MLVSVIIPCYNVEEYITKCIDSVINQTYQKIEIICIDNNSIDATWQKLQEIHANYPQIIIDKQLKPGAPAARNKGLIMSKGDWIQFLDADDLLLPTKIEHQVQLLGSISNVSFIAGNCYYIGNTGKSILHYVFKEKIWLDLLISNIGNTCSNLFNKSILSEIGGWKEDQKSSQEMDLMFRIMQRNSHIIYDELPLTLNISREGSITNSNKKENTIQYIKIRQDIYHYLKSNSLSNYEIDVEYKKTIYHSLITLSNYDLEMANDFFKIEFKGKIWSIENKFIPNYKKLFYLIFGFKYSEFAVQLAKKITNKA